MGARGECGAASHWLPTYVHKPESERQAEGSIVILRHSSGVWVCRWNCLGEKRGVGAGTRWATAWDGIRPPRKLPCPRLLGQRLRWARRTPLAFARGCAPAVYRERPGRSAGSRGSGEAGGTVSTHGQGSNAGRETGRVSLYRVGRKARAWFSLFGVPGSGVVLSFPLHPRAPRPRVWAPLQTCCECRASWLLSWKKAAGKWSDGGAAAAAAKRGARRFEKRHPLPFTRWGEGIHVSPKWEGATRHHEVKTLESCHWRCCTKTWNLSGVSSQAVEVWGAADRARKALAGLKVTLQGGWWFFSTPLFFLLFGVSLGKGMLLLPYSPLALAPGSCSQREWSPSPLSFCLVELSSGLCGLAWDRPVIASWCCWLSLDLGILPDLYCFCLV